MPNDVFAGLKSSAEIIAEWNRLKGEIKHIALSIEAEKEYRGIAGEIRLCRNMPSNGEMVRRIYHRISGYSLALRDINGHFDDTLDALVSRLCQLV